MNPLYKEIASDVQRAPGEVMISECRDRNVPSWTVASRGEFSQSTMRAIARGRRQPNLSAFITLDWALHMEPRELFDKILTAMRLPPGRRPVLNR